MASGELRDAGGTGGPPVVGGPVPTGSRPVASKPGDRLNACPAQYRLTIEPLGRTVDVAADQPLLQALEDAGVRLRADCGGNGLCGHCGVLLVAGEVEPLDRSRWTERREDGRRRILACQTQLRSDTTICLPPQALAGDIDALATMNLGPGPLGDAAARATSPLVWRVRAQLPRPTTDDNAPDWQRLQRRLLETEGVEAPLLVGLEALRELPMALRRGGFAVDAAVADRGAFREVIAVAPGDLRTRCVVGMAVDVGTSTVVVQAVDLTTGRLLGQAAGTNVQKRYGADVISRIIWSEEHKDGPAQMQRLILAQIGELLAKACEGSTCDPADAIAASLAGNATMTTFALGAHAGPIRRDPHVPVARELPWFRAGDLGLNLHPSAPVLFSPAVSGFVGGDITSGVLATGIAQSPELSLLVDVGTNGEIVLGNRDWLICCSCSAGPAFEGVDIAAGMHAMPGAIDRISFDHDARQFRWQTIGNLQPVGLCGTGLLEALAAMLRGGLLDRQGHLIVDSPTGLVREGEDEPEVVLVGRDHSGTGAEIVLRESEIENLLRSKAAVYAGISCLLRALQLKAEDIERLYIAGSFGNRLRVEEAVAIGLLPDVPRERIAFAGNTSLAGAYLMLVSRQAREQVSEIARKMTYLELSTRTEFMDEFVAALFLPHTDLSRFPSQRDVVGMGLA